MLLFGLLTLAACNKFDDLEPVNYSAEFAIPLFQTTTSFEELLENFDEDTYVTIAEDNLITLNYKGDITARTSDDLFSVIDQEGNLPFPILDTVFALPFNIPNSIDLDYGILKSGKLQWWYESQHDEPITVTVELPNASFEGESFSHTYTHSNGVNGSFFGPIFDLSEYRLEPINDSLYVRYQAYRINTQVNDTLTNFFMRFEDFRSSYVEGYLGDDIYELDRDTIEIEFFDNWTQGDVYFADPKILMTVENSFGFPVRGKANIMDVITVDGDVLELESPFVDSIDMAYPSLSEVGEVKYTYFSFTPENSNIDIILGSNPIAVDYEMDALPNPDLDTSIRGFMTDSSFFKVQVEVELPIYGTARGFEAFETFDVDFSAYDEADEIEFKLIGDNGVPLEVGAQVLFLDDNGGVLDSLFTPSEIILEAAPVDSEGDVTDIASKTTFIPVAGERLDRILTSRQVQVRTAFSTYNDGQDLVRITSTQSVNIRMGMKLGIEE